MRYDAFISYRHGGVDQLVAQTLHKEIEGYKVPKSVIGKGNGRTSISRVFRDREELPLSSNLEDNITQALEESEWLIVVCTRRLKESRWCMKEIDTFIQLHDQEHVLAVLVEGEPDESLPPQLLSKKIKVVDADGNTVETTISVEPMAADVRGNDDAEVKKLVKEEKLRILAPIFGVNYDDLKRRERERKIKRAISLASIILFVSVSFSIVSTTMMLKIREQRDEIEKKAIEIEQQNVTILSDKEQIESQNLSLKTNQAKAAGKEAFGMVLNDRKDTALLCAYNALTQMDGIDMPYTSEAELALSSSLDVYDNSMIHNAVRDIYSFDGTAYSIALSAKEQYLAVAKSYDGIESVDIFDCDTKALIANVEHDFLHEDCILFTDEDKLYIAGDGEIAIYQISGDGAKQLTTISCESSVYEMKYIKDALKVIITSTKQAMAIDTKDDTFVKILASEKEGVCGSSKNGTALLRYDAVSRVVTKIDTSSGEEISKAALPRGVEFDLSSPMSFYSIDYDDCTAYFFTSVPDDVFRLNTIGFAYNNKSGALLWNKLYNGSVRDFSLMNNKSWIYGVSSYSMYVIDLLTGEELSSGLLDTNCIFASNPSDEVLRFYSSNGSYYSWTERSGLSQIIGRGIDYNRTQILSMQKSADDITFYVLPNGDNAVYTYSFIMPGELPAIEYNAVASSRKAGSLLTYSEAQKEAARLGIANSSAIDKLLLIDELNLAVAVCDGAVYCVNTTTNQILYYLDGFKVEYFFLSEDYAFDKDNRLIVFCNDGALLFDENFELIALMYGACDYDQSRQEIIYKFYEDMYFSGPIWSVNELLEEAKNRLGK